MPTLIIGTKTDLLQQRQVSQTEISISSRNYNGNKNDMTRDSNMILLLYNCA